MDTLIASIVMGAIQGLTEFLPVSSSGHLAVAPFLLGGLLPGLKDPFVSSFEFSVILNFGTLAALLIYFVRDWTRLLVAFLATIRDRSMASDPDRRLAILIAVATVPALILGVLLHDIEDLIRAQVGLVATMLVVGAAILWLAERSGSRRRVALDLEGWQALAIGGAQALALVPGISRSGISISAGLFLGLRREEAARFSFLMAIPIVTAASLYEAVQVLQGRSLPVQAGPLAAGLAASFLFGVVAIAALLRFLRTRSTDVFVGYRLALAAVILIVWLG